MIDVLMRFDPERLSSDYELRGGSLAADAGLSTAIVHSLFTDARARDDDELPAGESEPRGWWGDVLASAEGDRYGSRLWLLRREKQTQETLNKAREIAEEALAWLIEDGIARQIETEAEYIRLGVLALRITVQVIAGAAEEFVFEISTGGA